MSKIKVDQLETLDGSATVNVADLASAGSGVTDHGALTGLADDDHPQYHTDARGDARYSQLGHGHAVSDVAGLQTALDGKAASSHGHAIGDVAGLQTALDGKAASGHGHAIADVAGLQTALDGKQDVLVSGTNIKTINGNSLLGPGDLTISSGGGGGVTDHGALTGLADDDHPQYHTDARGDARYSQLGHGHAVADVTGLQTALDGKAASNHTHTASQISDSTAVGRSVLTAADAAAARAAIGAGTGNGDVTLSGTQNLTNKSLMTVVSGAGGVTGAGGSSSLQVLGDATNGAYLSFHRDAVFAANFGIDTDNWLRYGGWSAGTGTTVFGISPTGNMVVRQSVHFGSQFNAGNSGTSVTVNFANGQKQRLTLTGNATVTLSFPGVGNYQLLLVQDGTGNRTVSWSGVTRWVGSATAPAINTAPNSSTVVSIYYDGANVWLGASKVNA